MTFIRLFLVLFLTFCILHAEDEKIIADFRANVTKYYDKSWVKIFSAKVGYKDTLNENLSYGFAVGSVQDFGLNINKDKPITYAFSRENKGFTLIEQAYLSYMYEKNKLTAGIFEDDNPLFSSDDYYMLANSFGGVKLENSFF
jgi:hypothetical protein